MGRHKPHIKSEHIEFQEPELDDFKQLEHLPDKSGSIDYLKNRIPTQHDNQSVRARFYFEW